MCCTLAMLNCSLSSYPVDISFWGMMIGHDDMPQYFGPGNCSWNSYHAWTFSPPNESYPLGLCTTYSEVVAQQRVDGFMSGGRSIQPDKWQLYSSYPAESPWVTAVGSTNRYTYTSEVIEQASKRFGTGGGFSNRFEAFEDQKRHIQGYLEAAPQLPVPSVATFSQSGRATPDVSLMGENFMIWMDDDLNYVSGTSASAPVFAAMISRLNEARLARGKPPMGYLNPFLYQHPEAFNDVTHGDNWKRRINMLFFELELTTPAGWNCTTGWDPVAGLGTPKFDELLVAALAIEPQRPLIEI